MPNRRLILKRGIALVFLATVNSPGTNARADTDAHDTAQLVGPGSVSSSDREFATSLSPDGSRLYFNRSGESGVWQIWVSRHDGGAWQAAQKVSFSDDRYSDLDPFVSRSGDRLYFSSDRPLPGSGDSAAIQETNTWYAPRSADGWGTPVFAGSSINSSASETFFSETTDGQVIFARFGEGAGRARPAYLMTARRDDSGFTHPRRIETLPSDIRLTNPAISPDGNLIIATGTRQDSPRLYFSEKNTDGVWAEFRLLPDPINIPGATQFAPYIANDGRMLYFSSDRPRLSGETADDDIYRTALPAGLGNPAKSSW